MPTRSQVINTVRKGGDRFGDEKSVDIAPICLPKSGHNQMINTKFSRTLSRTFTEMSWSSHKFHVLLSPCFYSLFFSFPFLSFLLPSSLKSPPLPPNVVFLLSPTQTSAAAMAMTSQSVVGNGAIEFQPSQCAKTPLPRKGFVPLVTCNLHCFI